MPNDAKRYFELYGYWLSTCNADFRLVVEQEMAEIEDRHPVLRQLK
jgi:hypothetical protein